MFDRDEVAAVNQERAKERLKERTNDLNVLARAAVSAENLTGQPEWDVFLSYLQAEVERIDTDIAETIAKQGDDNVVAAEEMIRLKIRRATLETAKRTLQAVIELPNDIRKVGEDARSILERISAE